MSVIRDLQDYTRRRREEAAVFRAFSEKNHEANRRTFAQIVNLSRDDKVDFLKTYSVVMLFVALAFYWLLEGGMMQLYSLLDGLGVLAAVDHFLNTLTGAK